MTTTMTSRRDGKIGLGLLALMTIAFVASETKSTSLDRVDLAPSRMLPSPVLIELGRSSMEDGIGGAIRELRVLPMTIDSHIDLHWSPDDVVIEEYRRSGY